MDPRRQFYLLYKKPYPLCRVPHFAFNRRILASHTGSTQRYIANVRSLSKPRVFPRLGWDDIDHSILVEEEAIPTYKPERFYPVYIGEVLNHRYQVVGKLGYGSTATVWLCRDLLNHCYVALKVYIASTSTTQEIAVYDHLKTIQSNHAGQSCLRPLIEIFQVSNPDGHRNHTCLVHPPLGISLDQLLPLLPDKVMSSAMVRTTMRNVLAALDFLQTEARVIHTDIQPNNILLGIKDNTILSQFEDAEFEAPIPRKTLEDRTIYLSRPLPISYGTPILCDLGEARLGTDNQTGDIMPDIYRAPEIILNMSWDYKVDIWNVGMVIWDLFQHSHLFRARNPQGKLDDEQHLAEIQAVLGSPPPQFLARSERSKRFWDENGQWKSQVPIPNSNLESREERLEGDEKEDFLRFLRRMLRWLPEERATAKELLFDPWLMRGLFK
ncbi:kinase-like protein [Aspergillus ibericus CBS 121593]|uniref:non-specific serine/threonine protein kinase n=1 Tax=Aspergillus ibericus CBS 121593 TaxID=1448316 RepID=A0A395H273_9EURO|nr:kinase-like protein [Aspergillus ibericus CBS 121593]RAL01305.1 kinase-like protein [Aspergillus ibericus CBS 121593]